ncbi:MAG: type II toxin-antitoxin system RelE/ParE family toxin [Candidatus Methanofastidiosia archaeon]
MKNEEWVIKTHPKFFQNSKKLDKEYLERIAKIILKIKKNPKREKPLKGMKGYFRVRFDGFRLIYCLKDNEIHLLIIEKRKKVYRKMKKRIEE